MIMRCLLFVFSSSLFLSAFLVFSVQPMVAKMLLPFLGGTPSVWNLCMVFFQAVLLAGYGYAHFITSRFQLRRQTVIHGILLVLAGLALPVAISDHALKSLPSESDPSLWLLGCLSVTVGLPFFVLAATAPLLQKWFSLTNHPTAADPYYLYAASNLGSLIALTSYPIAIEPWLRLREQSMGWSGIYWLFGLMALACAALALISRTNRRWGAAGQFFNLQVRAASCRLEAGARQDASQPEGRKPALCPSQLAGPSGGSQAGTLAPRPITAPQRLRWVLLAAVPSSLMLGLTTYLTTDIASIPLLWVLPLSFYLISFIVVFGRRDFKVSRTLERALAVGAASLTFLLVSEATQPAWLLIPVHVIFFFLAAWVCHGRLAEERPPTVNLTEFYFWISAGGVLGGLFNGLIAPRLFSRVIEYPLAMILAWLVHWKGWTQLEFASPLSSATWAGTWAVLRRKLMWTDVLLPTALGGATAGLVLLAPALEDLGSQWRVALIFGVPVVAGYAFVDHPMRFGLALAAILLASGFYSGTHGRTLHVERNFFGVLRVTMDPEETSRRLVHGNTIHGRQATASSRQNEPLSYYHRSGPLGDIFRAFDAKTNANRVAVVGLGTGSILSYARPNQEWTYYEINPAVLALARNTNYFTFLSHSIAGKLQLVLGDARLRLRESPDAHYDLLIIDAFSSDAIPVHLITREAVDLYLSKLAPGGLLVFHISNRCLDLEPVIGDLAHGRQLLCHAFEDISVSAREQRDGKEESHWTVLARKPTDLGRLAKSGLWLPVPSRAHPKEWSDDFSNLLHAFKWE